MACSRALVQLDQLSHSPSSFIYLTREQRLRIKLRRHKLNALPLR